MTAGRVRCVNPAARTVQRDTKTRRSAGDRSTIAFFTPASNPGPGETWPTTRNNAGIYAHSG